VGRSLAGKESGPDVSSPPVRVVGIGPGGAADRCAIVGFATVEIREVLLSERGEVDVAGAFAVAGVGA